jgi:RNA polymerase sigma-70 factor (ECF subfamily)
MGSDLLAWSAGADDRHAGMIQRSAQPTVPRDDIRFARRCAAGESSAFEQIYSDYGEKMKSIALNHLGNTADAEDAVQETFLKVHRAAGGYNGEAAFSTWLYRILVNTCYDVIRRRKRRIEEWPIDELPPGRDAHAPSADVAKRMTLRKLVDALPEQRRTVFVLFEVEGLSHAEIAGILDIKENLSKWLLFAAKKELQQQWNERPWETR